MEKNVVNYRVIIEPEKRGKKTVYNAYCPTLGVIDYGDSVEEVLESIKDGIELAIECLLEEKKEIPKDNVDEQLIATVRIPTNNLSEGSSIQMVVGHKYLFILNQFPKEL